MKHILAVFLILGVHFFTFAQFSNIKGTLVEEASQTAFTGSVIMLTNTADTLKKIAVLSDSSGKFSFVKVPYGNYRLKTEFIGYKSFEKTISAFSENIEIPVISLQTDPTTLKEVQVEGLEVRSKQKGDTTEFNAKAFKVNPDANAQDLVSKMPGVTIEGGTVKAQGEDVKKILVDGKEFFGNDVQMALKNLPADAIDKVQVFDRMNEQSRLTGFNDGNTEKSINITTKPGMGNGKFGRVYAGYGSDDRFSLGGNYNSFDKKRRISLVGQSNNINQQNFSAQDLAGISGGNSGRGGMGGGGGGMRRGGPPGGGPESNFMLGQQGGINTTNAYGINYTESFGKKINLSGSYFFNQTENFTQGIQKRIFYLPDGTNQFFDQNNNNNSINYNHRANARLEYNIDSSNSITLTPQISFQKNIAENQTNGKTTLNQETNINNTSNTFKSTNQAFNFSNNLLFNHKFAKPSRSYSISIGTSLNNRTTENGLNAKNVFFKTLSDSTQLIDQRANLDNKSVNLNTNISYSEPIGKTGALQFSYAPSINKNNASQFTNNFEPTSQNYTRLDTNLSNQFINNILTHSGGLTYRYKGKKASFNIGANYQTLHLTSEASFPRPIAVNKYFDNVLPTAMYQYTFDSKANLRLFYRTQTNVPSVSQLQNVVNNSNPVALIAGNPNLVQEYNHFLMMRYNISNVEKGRSFFIFMGGGGTKNYIANSSFIAPTDTILQQGVLLNRGSQLSKPVNLNGFLNFRSFVNYSMPIKLIKCNINFNAGYNFTQTPGLINQIENKIKNYNINSTLGIGSNISQKIDFNLAYNPNYTIINNTLQPQLNNNFYFANTSLRINILPWKGLVLNTEIVNTVYTGLGAAYNQNFWLWNAAIGYKFLKSQLAEIRLSVFDLLNQNNSAGRIVTEAYTEDNLTQVLRQYYMLTFTYNIKKMGSKPTDTPKEK
ncbi:MAG: TonB-dependent receptor [Cytophagales bacterium]|nr:MAG: TonB-dependent receptor [Cytophagales bacterium]